MSELTLTNANHLALENTLINAKSKLKLSNAILKLQLDDDMSDCWLVHGIACCLFDAGMHGSWDYCFSMGFTSSLTRLSGFTSCYYNIIASAILT